MDTLTAIKIRRLVRNYWEKDLDTDSIFEIVSYWLYAPSAHNQQARKYYIISKKEDRDFLAETMKFWKILTNPFAIISMWIKEGELPETKIKSEWKIEIN